MKFRKYSVGNPNLEPIASWVPTGPNYTVRQVVCLMTNVMKGKEYKTCILCGKKRAYGNWKALRPKHGICSSCLDLPDTNVDESIQKWKKKLK